MPNMTSFIKFASDEEGTIHLECDFGDSFEEISQFTDLLLSIFSVDMLTNSISFVNERLTEEGRHIEAGLFNECLKEKFAEKSEEEDNNTSKKQNETIVKPTDIVKKYTK